MHYYLYDSFVSSKKHRSDIFRIEARLADLGIQGKVGRLDTLKSTDDMIGQAIRQGAKTVIAVGNDETVSQCIRSTIDTNMTLGIIPLGEPNMLSSSLGIPYGVNACDVLSARIIKQVDVGRVNSRYFLSSINIPVANVAMRINSAYTVTPTAPGQSVTIYNFSFGQAKGQEHAFDPCDGKLNAVITGDNRQKKLISSLRGRPSSSTFPFKRADITGIGDQVDIIADGIDRLQTPVTVEVVPKRLSIIVGKERHVVGDG